jgi:signal transduction histidine kinase
MTVEERIEELRRIELTAGLPDERLRWLAEHCVPRVLEPGDPVFTEGHEPTEFFLILDGRVDSLTTADGEEFTVVDHQQYTFIGAIPLLSGVPYPGTTRALTRTRILALPADAFFDLVRDEPAVRKAVLATFRPVFQRFGSMQAQREKLAALGSLSAGLAHELNNPASAAGRAAQDLGATLGEIQDGVGRFAEHGLSAAELAALARAAADARRVAASAPQLDALDRADREDELVAALEQAGVDDPYELAADLVEAGIDRGCAKAVADKTAGVPAGDVLAWVAAGARAEALARELTEATGRIATLVRAVKEYTYMDRGGRQDVDVHHGLETTLTVLHHKLKKGDVRVVRDLQEDLPPVQGFGSELNQVWTNLIDNAIAALDGHGTLTLRSRTDGPDHIRIEVADDGPGIPAELQSRIFEPFFTTKDVGEGTGMGLDVAWRIVVQRHRGDLRVESRPGETRFIVRLPLQPHDAPLAASAGTS